MDVPVLTLFNSYAGAGSTSLTYHLAWMLSEIGHKVLVCDLDPQAGLTAAFLDDEILDDIWNSGHSDNRGATIYQCVRPLMDAGGALLPEIREISFSLALLPGDLALSRFENTLSDHWYNAHSSDRSSESLSVLTSFWTVMQAGAKLCDATVIIAGIAPSFGGISRSALIATDKIIVPLTTDLFSLQGMRNIEPTLTKWRRDWKNRRLGSSCPDVPLPKGNMQPIGYVVKKNGVRLDQLTTVFYDRVHAIPSEYVKLLDDSTHVLKDRNDRPAAAPANDKHCLAMIPHYHGLAQMAEEARKPMFELTPADGAMGSHSQAVSSAYKDYKKFALNAANALGLIAN